MKCVNPYPKEVTDLLTKEGYLKKFYKLTRICENNEHAYKTLERLHFRYFRLHRYRSYKSFLNSRNK